MAPAVVWILDRAAGPAAGPLERLLGEARAVNAAWLAAGFARAGADDARIERDADDSGFGARLRALVATAPPGAGGVVLGAGSLPLAREADLGALVATAASGEPRALVNSRYSADVTAVGRLDLLRRVPDLPTDNALPRWLAEVAGVAVSVLPRPGRLGFDLDSPLDVALIARGDARADLLPLAADRALEAARARLAAVAAVAADRRAELLVAGRTSARTLRWLERAAPARVRAVVEERGLRASASEALADQPSRPRPPASILGRLLDADGPGALGAIVAGLADAAVVDTRVLLAHRLGPDERRWPSPEDRFASDLLDDAPIADAWLRELTVSAARAPVPIALGGHTLVGPGLPLVLAAGGATRVGNERRVGGERPARR